MMSSILKKVGDFHTHNYRCNHATGNLAEYICNAHRKSIGTIGLSDHFPIDYSKSDNTLRLEQFAMKSEEVNSYLAEAEKLKNKYKKIINVRIGFEVGYLAGKEHKYFPMIKQLNGSIDYLIGSVHTVKIENIYWSLKNGDLKHLIKKYGAKCIYSQYFENIKQMLFSENFDLDIIGHLDYIKNGSENSPLNDFILKEIGNLIPYIKEKGVAVEINTQGLRNCYKKLYPCKKVVEKLYEYDIPIVLSSDAHNPKDVGYGFESVLSLIKKIGYDSIVGFEKRKMIYTALN
jgi:histidinol-phosphatase (PHP family)